MQHLTSCFTQSTPNIDHDHGIAIFFLVEAFLFSGLSTGATGSFSSSQSSESSNSSQT
ncbi:hypothetical protein BDV98DRAFT_563308 [Pterulicium gracile]|uniref:Uncharacterized protein n=1 Tax=Pterulicium gracile TaxID=1884261 RepID=A0A5C3QZY6_9AGAR|nr:hypothetical protein BDV98DRAFT_563308 [Pterula gracilis]